MANKSSRKDYINQSAAVVAGVFALLQIIPVSTLWDPDKEEIIGNEVATRLLSCPYRQPWTLPIV